MDEGAKKRFTGSLSVGRRLDRIEGKVDMLVVNVAKLNVKAGLWGAVGAGAVLAVLKLQGCG